jgi:hypothetical protein
MQDQTIKDPLPENFANIAEAADFWDTHSLADYWDQTREVAIEVRAPRRTWVALGESLARQVAERLRTAA